MNVCSTKMPEKLSLNCNAPTGIAKRIAVGKPIGSKLQVAKIIYNYKQKTDQQIKDAVQMEIGHTLNNHPGYRFVDSKSHFNKTGGIDMVLNFEKE